MTLSPQLHIFGIRHHGPGCARSLQQALDALQPDALLIEGPPEADAFLTPALLHSLKPPVALLIYAPDAPDDAAFYPFAEFSPEWQALQHAATRNIPVRFMDLPLSHRFPLQHPKEQPPTPHAPSAPAEPEPPTNDPPEIENRKSKIENRDDPFTDPLSHLAQAAGYPDAESWWDHLIESRTRHDPLDLFPAILEAMTALRTALPPRPDRFENFREAHMRKTIRAALKEGHQKIAIVCGAWHAPVLLESAWPPAKADNDLLKDLPKQKTAAAWVPWSYSRLSFSSGYGAGITSPGYYHHLFTHSAPDTRHPTPDTPVISWLTKVAHLLRSEDLDASSAHIIEAVRLAEALAAIRRRPAPTLDELTEATRTVLLFGDTAPLALIHHKLIVSDRLGSVPNDAAIAPLQLDLQRQQKRLRLPPDPAQKPLELDLRKQNDLERSQLLHRLNLLAIPWGTLKSASTRAKGTFKELWQTQWEPEFAIKLIEASTLGNSVYDAASAAARRTAAAATELPTVTTLLEDALQANLPEAVAFLLKRIDTLAAVAADLLHMMDALPPLASIVRYGNVRNTDTSLLKKVLNALLARIIAGLPLATASLNDEAAAQFEKSLTAAHAAIHLLYPPTPTPDTHHPTPFEDWLSTLAKLAAQSTLHGLLAGRTARLLLDARHFTSDDAATHLSLALSRAADPAHAAHWIEGFLKGSGLILLHDPSLLPLLNAWLANLPDDHFTATLPLLRRSFSQFPAPERQQIGRQLTTQKSSPKTATATATETNLNPARTTKLLPILTQLLGAPP